MRRRLRRPVVSWRLLVALLGCVAVLGLGLGVAQANPNAATAAAAPCTAAPWSRTAAYAAGSVVSHNGHQWRASFWIWPGEEPGVNNVPPWWVPWQDLGACGGGSTTTTRPPGSTTTTTQPPGSTTTTAPPAERVEDVYAQTGPWAVTSANVTVSGPGTVRLSYPSNLGANGVDHPILVWASGSALPASRYADTLDHLASWGYVVAAMSSPGFGGDEQLVNNMRATADYMVARNGDSSSPFLGKLDTAKVGVFGHSQGAQISALTIGTSRNSDGLIKSALPFNLPSGTPTWQVDEPILFFFGTADVFTDNAGQTTFFNHVTGPAAKAALVGGGHGGGLGGPAIDEPDNPYQGYLVAWFKYTLEGDQFARRAFVGSPAEISTDSAFTNWQAKNLP
jgi:dienelactone hydrolase